MGIFEIRTLLVNIPDASPEEIIYTMFFPKGQQFYDRITATLWDEYQKKEALNR